MQTHGGNSQPLIDKEEHRYKNVGVKGVLPHVYDTSTDKYYPQAGVANADGTFSVRFTDGGLVAVKDYDLITVTQTSATVETYVYSLAAVTKRTITVTYTDATRATVASVGYA